MELSQDSIVNIKEEINMSTLNNTNTLKFFSPVLNEEIELETNGLMGPKHASLERLLYDKLTNVNIEMHWVKAEPDHSVVQATIWSDNPKRRIITNGESTTKSLQTDIASKNPATIAFNRAFDRAVLKYLGLYYVYADSENVVQELQDFFTYNSAPANQESPVATSVTNMTPLDQIVNNISNPMPASAPVAPVVMTEEQEYYELLNKPCLLREYENGKGIKKHAPFGWILKTHPEDLHHFAATNAAFDINSLRITDPTRAQALVDLYRVLELYEKFKKNKN